MALTFADEMLMASRHIVMVGIVPPPSRLGGKRPPVDAARWLQGGIAGGAVAKWDVHLLYASTLAKSLREFVNVHSETRVVPSSCGNGVVCFHCQPFFFYSTHHLATCFVLELLDLLRIVSPLYL
jgi:hypothetical protein